MHELSLAEALVAVAVRQVVPASLEFAFELLAADTVLAGSRLTIEEVAARGTCRVCGVETTMERFPLQCSECLSLDLEIVAGEELRVQALELEEHMTTRGVDHGR